MLHRNTWARIEEMGFVVQQVTSGAISTPSASYTLGGREVIFDPNLAEGMVIITGSGHPQVIIVDNVLPKPVVFIMKNRLEGVHGKEHPDNGISLKGQTVNAVEAVVGPTHPMKDCENVYRITDKGPFFGMYVCNHMIDHLLDKLPKGFVLEELPKRRIKKNP